ncbi:unnamed protein product [Agarophyton chilense]
MVSRKRHCSRLLATAYVIALIHVIPLVQGKNWKYEEVPFPGNDTRGECGHSGRLRYVCDPDMFLSSKEAESIERQLTQIHEGSNGFKKLRCLSNGRKSRIETGPDVYAIILGSLRRSLLETGTKDLRACRFATKLIKKWGIGDASCGYGVIILVSVRNRALAVSPTGPAKLKLTNAMKEGVKELMLKHVRDGELGKAFNESVNAVGVILSDGTPPFPVGYSLGTVLQSIGAVGMVLMIGLMCYVACSRHQLNEALTGMVPSVQRIITTSSIDYGYQEVMKRVVTRKTKNEYERCAICGKDIEGGTWNADPEDMFCTKLNEEEFGSIGDDDPLHGEIVVNDGISWRRLVCDHPIHMDCFVRSTGRSFNPLDKKKLMCQKCWDRSS